MTGFLERLALRGAGLARPGSPVAMRLRPRGRFEPGPAVSAPAEDPVGADSGGPSPWPGQGRPDIANRPAPLPERNAEPALHRPAAAEPAPPPLAPRRPPPSRTPADIAVAEEKAAAERPPDPAPPARADRPGDISLEPIAAPEPERMHLPAPPAFVEVAVRALPEGPAAAGREGPPAPLSVQWRSERPDGPEADAQRGTAPAAPALRSPPAPPSAPVALSIGRIDVEFVNPPAPPVAAPQAVSRTRGFASYSRIRRGSPR